MKNTIKTRLIGSADSLESLASLIKQKWSWSEVIFKKTELPHVWTIQSSSKFAGFIEGLQVAKRGKRYRLESLEVL